MGTDASGGVEMNKTRYILIVILLIISSFALAEKLFTPEQLREDLDFLVSKIVEEYYNPCILLP